MHLVLHINHVAAKCKHWCKCLMQILMDMLLNAIKGYEEEEESGSEGSGRKLFILHDSVEVVKSEAGGMKVVKGITGKFVDKPMHIGFIYMEPKSLFIPQYLDSNLILFIRRGEAKVGSIRNDKLVEQDLKTGDIYTIDAGSVFYIENTGEGQRLQIICSIDTSESLTWHAFQSFFIGGGRNPSSILAGFDKETLSTAFNVSVSELEEFLSPEPSGAIVYISPESKSPNLWTHFINLEHHQKKAHLKKFVLFEGDVDVTESKEERPSWSLGKLVKSLFINENKENKDKVRDSGDDVYNLYDRNPDFQNSYGWSLAVDDSQYKPLNHSGIGVYLVNLTAGSMMAPHINPTASEYGIVLRGSGSIQIVFPNGTLAMNTKVNEGDVFWIPRYFPFCQISSRTGPLEFFGFTTSSQRNHPQFLVGRGSLFQTMFGRELVVSFGSTEKKFEKFIYAQNESTILSTASVAPPDDVNRVILKKGKREKMIPKLAKKLSNDMMMGFE
nr:PREDICTED: vicilin-like seed storage protein At2g28490 isoform X1 [Daucus carota subsp. sativus]XP_017252498.1 PREDICTED: vicilin-like seed storage protein At2g28490 isoform X1 [Daucus carota subsp. sativus]